MVLYSSLSAVPWNMMQIQLCNLKVPKKFLLHPTLNCVSCECSSNDQPVDRMLNLRIPLLNGSLPTAFKLRARNHNSDLLSEESVEGFEWNDQEQGDMEGEESGSPWEGAVIYRRNASILHLEYCTTLERLGLGNISSAVSKSCASEMGLRVTNAVKDYPDGTPVLISLDVTRKKQKLRLDGIVRTVISLQCNRCGEPAGKSIFSNFSFLLTEEPFEEPDTINMGVIFGEEKFRTFVYDAQEEDDDDSIDFDDQLHFPPEDKEIDISKPIRDLLHVEITIDEICDPKCKGICLRCGVNLNNSSCKCKMQNADQKHYGPLGSLRKQVHQS